MLGRKHSKETRRKISETQRDKNLNRERRQKISAALMGNQNCLGRVVSNETKRKMSVIMAGERNPNWGKRHTDEAKRKMRAAAVGRAHTEETKRKISKAGKQRWARKRRDEKQTPPTVANPNFALDK